jgi:hypothetical protein
MSDEDKDYSAQSRSVINKRQREIDRTKEMAEAMTEQIAKAYKKKLTNEDNLINIRQEIINGMNGRNRGNSRIAEQASRLPDGEGQVFVNEGTITGFEDEDPYWRKDDT